MTKDSPTLSGGNHSDQFLNFVFKRELDQVYRLLDHISMSETKHLPAPPPLSWCKMEI